MKIFKYITTIYLAILLISCYEDKGNYTYNEGLRYLDIKFTPEYIEAYNNECTFKFKQPLKDTTSIRISANIEKFDVNDQTLKFQWTRKRPIDTVGKTDIEKEIELRNRCKEDTTLICDTIRTPYIDVKIAPRKSTNITYNFKIEDTESSIDYYKTVIIKTITPYVDSWFVLSGKDGDRKVGTIEKSEEKVWIVTDAYKDLYKKRRFQHAENLTYLPSAYYDFLKAEMLTVIAKDSLYSLYPFDLSVKTVYEQMIASVGERPIFIDGYTDRSRLQMIRTNDKKLYNSPGSGHYYKVLSNPEDNDYKADDYSIIQYHSLIWDNTKKKFFYYIFYNNRFGWDTRQRNDAGNQAKIIPIGEDVFATTEFQNKEFIKILPDVWNDKAPYFYALFKEDNGLIVKYLIRMRADGDSYIEYEKTTLEDLTIDKNTPITTSWSFANQLFYAKNNILYRYDMINKKTHIAYETSDSRGTIEYILFKKINEPQDNSRAYFTRNVGLIVNYPGNKGEIHELLFEDSGDINQKYIMGGFEHIKSIIFSESRIKR